jgi:DNA-binding MarR family transcriptional regulator
MPRRELLESEKKVLYGLVKYAGSTDQYLGEKLGMKVPTITAIRMKLKKMGYYTTKVVPFLQYLGAELVTVSYVRFSSHPSLENKLKEGRRVMNREEFIYSISEAKQDFFIQISKNYTDSRMNIEDIEGAYKGTSYFEEGITSAVFPYDLSEMPYYFNFASLLAKAFGFEEEPDEKPKQVTKKARASRLSNKEKTVLFGLVKYPDLNDIELSEKINASRMTIGKTRKKLQSMNLIKTINIPNLELIGFELMVITHAQFNLGLTEGLKYYVPELLSKIGPNIFTIFGKNDIIIMNVFKDFNEYKRSTSAFTELYKEHELFSSPPKRLEFSILNLVIAKNHEYSGFVGKCLGLNTRDIIRD